jgi:hypothetical protein
MLKRTCIGALVALGLVMVRRRLRRAAGQDDGDMGQGQDAAAPGDRAEDGNVCPLPERTA